ncbi:tryptophan--tRNA ligase [Enterobacteriaceae endosymbiont of Plateumaris rustica]|uniref:tryptophan--tRNA ligase n=1 Tax=Enterobacteriaceae endosymbiont of Plateumaris rustica TaxID=2675796 RepID=UPI001448E4E7|nr:tryptophan--tRNA ligase [Enterobacteriaceae endosymbiont of Plateumaris rustica]QJC29193.1 tryptophan--tRNA ligase [Enterobacteriaceae endosymbiont of Plateumaris rustica]
MLNKLTVFSAIQPTGNLTIGNYIGALRQWKNIQNKYFCIFSIADLHSLTIYQKPNILNKNILDTLAIFLACGINPSKNIIFIQSHVPQHTQLSWILNYFTYFGELKRMIQFKEKILLLNNNKINIGLFNYPVLMAADILLYQANKIPVGKDQIQHIEMVRNIAIRFNSIYGKIFTIPEKIISSNGSCIMSLLNPLKKMSKSDLNSNNIISLFDSNDIIVKKINNAVTDSNIPPNITYDKIHKPGISNLLSILSNITNNSIQNLEIEFKGKIYSDLKKSVIEHLCIFLNKFRKKYYNYRENKKLLDNIIINGSNQAQKKAKVMLNKVNNIIGLY